VSGPDLTGEVLDGRYHVLELIGEGAMGVVYRATRLHIDRAVAVKVMHTTLPEAMEGRKRFEREAKVMAKLEHPHCVSIVDFGIHHDKPYVVMELVRGKDLCQLLDDHERLDIPVAVDILRQTLSGLAHAHEQGIIHRDIKPANIMITPKAPLGNHVRILDFGLARLLAASASASKGVAVGTPSYMAPEQCRGDPLDARVDIYACGVVLFEMLTGKKPFRADDPIDIIKKHLEEPAPRLADVTPGDYGALEDIVARALAKAPADRFASALAMASALDALDDAPAAAPSRTRTAWWLVGGALVTAGAAASVFGLQRLAGGDTPRVDGALVGPSPVDTPPVDTPAPIVTPAPIDVAPPSAHDPAADLAAEALRLAGDGKLTAALDMVRNARLVYPRHAQLAFTAGKLFMSRMWWSDALVHLRDAVKLDPALRSDPELLGMVVRAFNTTPSYDTRLASFLIELGGPAKPLVQETARSHKNPRIRARAESLLRRMR
jgi:eukaryotic-like serine/threonine-protein kinase